MLCKICSANFNYSGHSTAYFFWLIDSFNCKKNLYSVSNCNAGFVCVRGFDQKTRAPRPLMARLHFPASRMTKGAKGRTYDDE